MTIDFFTNIFLASSRITINDSCLSRPGVQRAMELVVRIFYRSISVERYSDDDTERDRNRNDLRSAHTVSNEQHAVMRWRQNIETS